VQLGTLEGTFGRLGNKERADTKYREGTQSMCHKKKIMQLLLKSTLEMECPKKDKIKLAWFYFALGIVDTSC